MFGFWRKKTSDVPFKGESFKDSDIELELIYDHCLDRENWESYLTEELRPKWDKFTLVEQVEIQGNVLIIKGRRFRLQEKIYQIFRTSLNTIIVRDGKNYRDIHAFSLVGEHLWDIEGLRLPDGKRAYALGRPVAIKKNSHGVDLLLLNFHPYTFATDLRTGKGTYLYSRFDDTNEK